MRMRNFQAMCCFIFFMWLALPAAGFSESADEHGSYMLGEVVVTGEREGAESVGTVRVITARDIRNRNARTLDKALTLLPGVLIRTGTDGVPRVDLRGFRSRHVTLLLDGIPFNSTFDGQFDPSIIPTENIAAIKVMYGDHSVLYGDGGLGGVINIITKAGKEGIQGMANGEIGEKDSYLSRFSLSGGRNKVNFFASGSYYETDGFPLSDDFEPTSLQGRGLRENTDENRKNAFANLNFSPTERTQLGAVFNYLKGEFGKPPSVIENFRDDPFANRPRFDRVEDYEGYSAQASISHRFTDLIGVRGWAFYNQLKEDTRRYDDDDYGSIEEANSFREDSRTEIRGVSLQPKVDFGSAGTLTFGMHAKWDHWENDGFTIASVSGGGGGGGGGSTLVRQELRGDEDLSTYTASFEYDFSPVKNLVTVLGYGHSWFKKDEGDDNESFFRVGSFYDLTPSTRIKGSVARQIRFPTIRQLYGEGEGDPDLTAERSYNYQLGVEQVLPWSTRVAVAGFREDVEDYIEKIDVLFENNDKYRFTGFEVTAENSFFHNLLLRAGYSYLHTEDRSPGSGKDELQYRPTHKVTLEGKYLFNFGFSIYANVLYVADQVFYSRSEPFIKAELKDYTVVSAKLDQAVFGDRLHIYVGADNLFDENYVESYGFPQAGRFIYGGVTIRFWGA